MRTLAFDGRMGASGDMILGALIAAGADPAVLEPIEERLPINYEIGTATRAGIQATSVTVRQTNGTADPPSATDESSESDDHQNADHDHAHSHHEDEHGHSLGESEQDHSHDTATAEHAGPHRSYPEVVEIVQSLPITAAAESDAIDIFTILGEAEASIHGTNLEETHFHEVGADDAIADVVGAAVLLADLDPAAIVTTPVATGGGEVEMSHGVYPVPAPAVVEIAEHADWSLRGGPVESELLTPTGAAILAHYATGVDSLPPLDLDASGYGAGAKSFDSYPNVLRAMIGESTGDLRADTITVLETNLDDATPEVLGSLQESLRDVGARDVSIIPTTTKKARPGHLVKIVVKPEDARAVARKLARETGTLGIREQQSGHRFIADRDVQSVTLNIAGESFEVDVKTARFSDGEVFDVSCEFDDARAVANETDRSVREIIALAENHVRSEGDQ